MLTLLSVFPCYPNDVTFFTIVSIQARSNYIPFNEMDRSQMRAVIDTK